MEFASFAYLAFVALASLVYFALPSARLRTAWLLIASLAFYYSLSAAWTAVLLGEIVLGYVSGLLLERFRENTAVRRTVLALSIGTVVAVLAVFKYATFAASGVTALLGVVGRPVTFEVWSLVLPVGVSFWTFQTIAYVVEVSQGKTAAQRDPLRYATFIAFFGHVTAGPIARANQLLPQLAAKTPFSYDAMKSGLLLMGWGFFKKLMVADPMGALVDFVYRSPHKFGGTTNGMVLLAATVCFAIQIYCDFSGYTDIVRGSARIFGIDLVANFNRPYFARSVKEFWQRWHMSLMSWLRDFVYIPLGGSRVPTWRRYLNIALVFLVSGLWHGAGLSFVVWGLLNAAYQIVGDITQPVRERLRGIVGLTPESRLLAPLQMLTTFSLVTFAWTFFRAKTLADGVYIASRMWMPTFSGFSDKAMRGFPLTKAQVVVLLASTAIVFLGEALAPRLTYPQILARQPLVVRWATYLVLIAVLTVLGRYGPAYDASGFAYFRF